MPTESRIRVLAVDDHPLLRAGIVAMLETAPDLEVVAAVGTAREGLEALLRLDPDVTLMDLQLPDLSGIAMIRRMRAERPRARIVVLTTYRGDGHAREALAAGAVGYLLKSVQRAELIDTLRRVHAGHRHVCAEISSELACRIGEESLTPRELDTLQLLAQGLGNKQIATALGISTDTVKAHLTSVFEKLGAHTRTEASAIAARRGLLPTDPAKMQAPPT